MTTRRQHGEGSVYKRGKRGGRDNSQWVAVADLGWREGRRDRREFTGATPDEAMEKRQRFLDRRRDGFTMPRGRQPYVSEWMLHWLHNIARRKVAETTWHGSYRQKVTDHIAPFFERTPLPELDEEMVEEWHRHLEDKGLSAATITQCHRIFAAGIKQAVVRKRIVRNPLSNVTPPRIERAEPDLPSPADVGAILDRCATWPGGARWVLAILTGIRQGEALALRWADVRLEDPAVISITRSAARANRELVTKAPKSAKSRRVIPVGPEAVAALREHRRGQVASIEGLVFTDGKGGPRHPRRDWQDWCDLLDDLGLPHYRVHDLRHLAGTLMMEAGVDVRVVQEQLGHASPAFTASVYQHVRQEVSRDAALALERQARRR